MNQVISNAISDKAETITIALIAGVIVFAVALWALLALVSFLFKGMGLYRIAKRIAFEDPWRAFIPYFSRYIFSEMVKKDVVIGKRSMKLKHYSIGYMLLNLIAGFLVLASFLFVFIPIVGWIITGMLILLIITASTIVEVFTVHRFFEEYQKDKAVLFTVISVLIPFSVGFILFFMKNKPFVMEVEEVLQTKSSDQIRE